jgi:general secretion pathway protein N
MPLRGRLIAAGVVTLLIGLVTIFPARVAYRWLAPASVGLEGISGSVWNGRAAQAQVEGFYVRDLAWRFRPLGLVTGNLSYAVEATPASGFINATVLLGVTGAVRLEDLQASLPLQPFEGLVGMPGLRGTVNLQFERIVIEDGLPVAANGRLAVADLVAPMIHRGSIGGYRADFFTQNTGVLASIEDTDGVVDIAGSFEIAADRSYQFLAQLAPKAGTPHNLRQQMNFLGTANDRGQYELRLEGQL